MLVLETTCTKIKHSSDQEEESLPQRFNLLLNMIISNKNQSNYLTGENLSLVKTVKHNYYNYMSMEKKNIPN